MDRADPCAGIHADQRFGDHRHIEQNAVALAYTMRDENRRQCLHLLEQFGVGEALDEALERRVMDDGDLMPASVPDMAVEQIEAGV